MVKKRIVLTKQEYRQLSQILNSMKAGHRLNQPHLLSLYEEVGDAVIMERDDFSSGHVTMNTRVRYTNLDNLSEHTVRLVFPADVEKAEENCSIFTPVGAALIGEAQGNICVCKAPAGMIPLRIEEIETLSSG